MIQLPKLYICTVQIPRVGIIFVHHEGVMPIVNDWCDCFYLNIMGIFNWLFFMLKWMNIFMLLQICLGNADAWIRMIIFDVEVDEYFCTVTGLFRYCRCLKFLFSIKWSANQTWELIFRKKQISFSVKCLTEPNMGIDFP